METATYNEEITNRKRKEKRTPWILTSFIILTAADTGGGGAGFFLRNVEFTDCVPDDLANVETSIESCDNFLGGVCKLWHDDVGDIRLAADKCCMVSLLRGRGLGWGDVCATTFSTDL